MWTPGIITLCLGLKWNVNMVHCWPCWDLSVLFIVKVLQGANFASSREKPLDRVANRASLHHLTTCLGRNNGEDAQEKHVLGIDTCRRRP
ncbi:hypothetical protein JOM56_003224 [Amanita muscaria]